MNNLFFMANNLFSMVNNPFSMENNQISMVNNQMYMVNNTFSVENQLFKRFIQRNSLKLLIKCFIHHKQPAQTGHLHLGCQT